MDTPFSAFNFLVRLVIDGESTPICDGAFAEVSGLEATLEMQTIREGGNNARQIHLAGAVSYGTLRLKRGLTRTLDLWRWFDQTQRQREVRASGEVVMRSADRATESIRFALTGCLPKRVVAPTLDAIGGTIAIEEMEIAYETLAVRVGG